MIAPRRALLPAATFAAVVAAAALWIRGTRPASSPATPDPREAAARAFLALEARETALDRAAGAPESAAETHEDALDAFWDDLNARGHAWPVFLDAVPDSLAFPRQSVPAPAGFDDLAPRLAPGGRLDAAATRAWIAGLRDAGWSVRRSRWKMPAHDVAARRSTVAFELLAERASDHARAQVRGEALVEWTAAEPPRPVLATVTRLAAWGTAAPAAFAVEADIDIPVPPGTPFTDPLLAVTDASGATQLIAVGAGVRWRRDPAGRWTPEPFASLPPQRLWAGTLADWDGDGADDLVLAGSDGVRVVRGPAFAGAGEAVWPAPSRLMHPQVVAAGDYDGDGRLDFWIGQYKLPYQGGQFPTPWHDAIDGFPSYLLHREGPSALRDATADAGLAGKQRRRVYSGSFVDLDGDGRPDLVTASDFAGLDVFLNAGGGKFRDVTGALADARRAFGMAHVSGDFDGDGRMDVLMAGMQSTVASRLDALGIEAPGETRALRAAMTAGNRAYTMAAGVPVEAPWARGLADAGWAWAVTPFDADNDGQTEFHVANGHETRAGTRDYERQFWRHDLHVAASTNDPVADLYFRDAAGRRAADKASYGGWQHGALFRRAATGEWADVGWLLGTSVFADTRNAVAADFDGDGRMDLAVTTFEEWPARRQRLVVLRNQSPPTNHWVGFRFDGRSSVGATVRVVTTRGVQLRRVASGESFRSQAVGAVHFGLGPSAAISSAEVVWPDGRRQPLAPVADRWNRIAP